MKKKSKGNKEFVYVVIFLVVVALVTAVLTIDFYEKEANITGTLMQPQNDLNFVEAKDYNRELFSTTWITKKDINIINPKSITFRIATIPEPILEWRDVDFDFNVIGKELWLNSQDENDLCFTYDGNNWGIC